MTGTESLRQGSIEWKEERRGKVTASRFKDILTQPRAKRDKEQGNLSATSQSYLLDVVAEILTGQSQDPPVTTAMLWGTDCEPAAVDVYANLTGTEPQEVGFVTHPDEPMIGGSPDRLIGDDGGLEVKCPFNTRVHLGYRLAGVLPADHEAQVQGLLWITGRKWWDFVSFDPRVKDFDLGVFRVRVERDEERIGWIAEAVFAFRDKLLETSCALKTLPRTQGAKS